MSIQNIKLPRKANDRVKKLWDDMVATGAEHGEITREYQAELIALNEKFVPRFHEFGERMYALKKDGIQEICKIAEIDYRPENGYAIEASYYEFGDTYMAVRTPDIAADATPEQKALMSMEIPPGSKAN